MPNLMYHLTASPNLRFRRIFFDTQEVFPNLHRRQSPAGSPNLFGPSDEIEIIPDQPGRRFRVVVDATLTDAQPWWWVLEMRVNGQPTRPPFFIRDAVRHDDPSFDDDVRF